MREDLAKKSLWGLPAYSQACLLNIYFFSKLNYYIPYVVEADDSFLTDLVNRACDRINRRRLLPNGKYSRRKYDNKVITASIDQGGFNLRDLVRFADSLRAVRAFRFFNRGSPALKDASFQFYSDSDHETRERACERMTRHILSNSPEWSRYLSPTMSRCLKSLTEANSEFEETHIYPTIFSEPTAESDAYAIWEYNKSVERAELAAKMRLFLGRLQGQRHADPVRHLNEEELVHLEWGTDFRTDKQLMALWRHSKKLLLDGRLTEFVRPKKWDKLFPKSRDPFYAGIMGKMRSHYLKNAYQAETLHHLRIGRVKVQRSVMPESYGMSWRQPGCGICRSTSTDNLHQHIFCDCPVLKAILLRLGIEPVDSLEEWVYGEEPLCRRKSRSKREEKQEADEKERRIRGNYYRELADGIWKLERKLRRTGEDANQVETQEKFSNVLKRAQSCFLKIKEYEATEMDETQRADMVKLWLEESWGGVHIDV
ncbi:reverse transcriptase [Yarrowia sp. C11]|nr:reverse transcriptase [Yarrowia sp. C11]